MRTKTKISLRIDDDLLKVLKNNSTGNLTAYIEGFLSAVAVKPPTLGGGYKATHTL